MDPHVHIQFGGDEIRTNPIRDLFSYTGTSSVIDKDKFKLTGYDEKKGDIYYINKLPKKVTIEAYIETETKDLDTVEFSLNPSISDFPIKFDYHNHSQWTDYDGEKLKTKGMRCISKCDKDM